MFISHQIGGLVNRDICLFILLLVLRIYPCASTQLSFNEGGQAELLYHYNQEHDLDVEIRLGRRPPFYQHGVMLETGLSPDQRERFSVFIEKHTALDVPYQMFLVRVKIENVSREDAGTYICKVYQNGHINEQQTKKVGLNIEFPPGKARCVLGPNQVDTSSTTWFHLKCTASIGSRQGLIECYQDGERMPPWTRPINQNRSTLVQTLWIRKSLPIFCCSSTYDRVSNMCQCKDFIRDFSISNRATPGLYPCPSGSESSTAEPSQRLIEDIGEHEKITQANSVPTSGQHTLKPSSEGDSDSSLVLKIILVFTVINSIGIVTMIVITSAKKRFIDSIKNILCNNERNNNNAEVQNLQDNQ
nr:uncharacterized protein LOC129259730 [Lytechinus pictus]